MKRLPRLLALLALLSSCDAEPELTLSVDIRTDFAPGLEFEIVRVITERGDGSDIDSDREPFAPAADYIAGARAAEHRVPRGVVELEVTLLDANGSEIVSARRLVDVDVDTSVLVVLPRSCRCRGGTCPDPSSCVVPCEAMSDCPTPSARCAGPPVCTEGACFAVGADGACVAEGEYCDPEASGSGCVLVPDGDAGTPGSPPLRHTRSRSMGNSADVEVTGLGANAAGDHCLSGTYRAEAIDLGGGVVLDAPAGGETLPFVACFAADGAPRWAVPMPGAADATFSDVAVADDSTLIAGGTLRGDLTIDDVTLSNSGPTGSDGLLLRFDATGRVVDGIVVGDLVDRVALDGAGGIVVAGRFLGDRTLFGDPVSARGGSDVFVARADTTDLTSSTGRWIRRYGSTRADRPFALDVANGVARVAGAYEGQVELDDGSLDLTALVTDGMETFVIALAAGDGAAVEAARFGFRGIPDSIGGFAHGGGSVYLLLGGRGSEPAAPCSADVGPSILGWADDGRIADATCVGELSSLVGDTIGFGLGPRGDLYAATEARRPIVFAGHSAVPLGEDTFIASFSPTGEPRFGEMYGGRADDASLLLATSADSVFLAGTFTEDTDFGGGPLGHSGRTDVFLVTLGD